MIKIIKTEKGYKMGRDLNVNLVKDRMGSLERSSPRSGKKVFRASALPPYSIKKGKHGDTGNMMIELLHPQFKKPVENLGGKKEVAIMVTFTSLAAAHNWCTN